MEFYFKFKHLCVKILLNHETPKACALDIFIETHLHSSDEYRIIWKSCSKTFQSVNRAERNNCVCTSQRNQFMRI